MLVNGFEVQTSGNGLDSNRRSLSSETTALPTEPQPMPKMFIDDLAYTYTKLKQIEIQHFACTR